MALIVQSLQTEPDGKLWLLFNELDADRLRKRETWASGKNATDTLLTKYTLSYVNLCYNLLYLPERLVNYCH